MPNSRCRFCQAPLTETVLDLGASPLANSFIDPEDAVGAEPFYPLSAAVCSECFLVQVPDVGPREQIFNESYIYHSSWSQSVLAHARQYVDAMCERIGIGPGHQVVEVASNDGYLLQYFVERGVSVLGIEPCESVASVARARGVTTRRLFCGEETARALRAEGVAADLLVANNVFAHTPDINDFTTGLKILLAPDGVATLEFPHLLRMIEDRYFDTIYHEHFSYLSLLTAEKILAARGLRVFDVEEIAPQGGSLRVYACHAENAARRPSERLGALRAREIARGLGSLDGYRGYAEVVHRCKRDLLRFLIDSREAGRKVVGYGAPAKGNTLLNFCGIKPDLLPFTVDVSPYKQGLLLPGSRIPTLAPESIYATRPDYVLILAWNIKDEVMAAMAGIAAWGGRFVLPLPKVTVIGGEARPAARGAREPLKRRAGAATAEFPQAAAKAVGARP